MVYIIISGILGLVGGIVLTSSFKTNSKKRVPSIEPHEQDYTVLGLPTLDFPPKVTIKKKRTSDEIAIARDYERSKASERRDS